jgi:protein gp37
MAEKTTIGWCDHTFNLAWGCWKISPGCENCFADAWDARFGGDHWGRNKPRKTMGEKYWSEPLKWNRDAEKEGRRHRVFCSSMTDVFLDDETIKDELLKLWPLIRETPWLTWLLLTKRPERAMESLPSDWGSGYPNAWIGVSCENQEYADKRIPILTEIPAVIRFVSYEPALGPIDFTKHFQNKNRPDWVIVGGESGQGARPFDMEWARSTVQQCRAFGVSPFVKQLGYVPITRNPATESRLGEHAPRGKKFPDHYGVCLIADTKGGNWDEWPSGLDDIKVREFPVEKETSVA